MNTQEIDRYMKKYKNYGGTFACDRLHYDLPLYSGLIVNTDESHEPGQHWVAIYRSDSGIIYFDSFGLPPIEEKIEEYLDKIAPRGWYYNSVGFQSMYQDTCGMHCIYFLICMFKFNSFQQYLDLFNKSKHENDILSKLIYKLTK